MADTLKERLDRAWTVARRNFGDEVAFYAPCIKRYETSEYANRREPIFVPVSVTGSHCALQCDHCRGFLLGSMYEARDPERLLALGRELKSKGCRGMLVSGGADADGKVPLLPFAPAMARLKSDLGLRLAVHTGLADEREARALADAEVDVVMLDIIGDDETIRRVCHLRRGVNDYDDSLRRLADAGLRLAPHIVIGLHYGEIRGERRALDVVAQYPIDVLVLVVLMPSRATAMGDVTVPTPEAIAELFVEARKRMPQTRIALGCARPPGPHQFATDVFALRAGLNAIAYPADGVATRARELGLRPRFFEHCCSFLFEDLPEASPRRSRNTQT